MNEKTVENILKVEGVKAKGFGIIPKLAMQDDRLTIEAKAIYSYFCSFAGAGTTAFPSIDKIVKDLRISVKRYYRHFELLKKYGYIKTEQIKNDGKFDRNIYTLVENPEEIPTKKEKGCKKSEKELINRKEKNDNSPIGQNDQTEDSPFGHFGNTQNDQTNNNNIKNNSNNIYITNHSVNHNSINNTNRDSNTCIDTNRETERMNDRQSKELEKIYQKSQVDLFNEDEKIFMKKIIADLFCSERQKVKDRILDSEEIRMKLHRLTLNTLDYAIRKFKESKNFTKVNNPEKYFRVILLNSVDEAELEKIRTG
ncbi:MAG: hypothetical protein PWQ37_2346 [Candidatus Petromonas sp.]|nr:hypothetical protein [Candidatus Petromonas sp.]